MNNPYFIRRQGLARLWLAAVLLLLLGLRLPGLAQTISTVAGDGTTSGTGTSTGFTLGVAVDPSGNVYVAGGNAHVIRRITPGGAYSTIAGTGTAGFSGDGGPATAATLNAPSDVFIINNTLYIADMANRRIRKVDLNTGVITTVAGDGTSNITGSGIGFAQGVAADAAGNVYVATGNGHVIRRITTGGAYSNFVGTGTAGFSGDGGPSTSAQVNNPLDIFFSSNALYIADLNNRYIRKVDLSTNVITSVAGDGTTGTSGNGIGFPNGVSVDAAGNILVATGNGNVIRKITPGGVHSTVAGTGTAGFSGDNGPAASAQVASPIDMSALGNDIYVADRDNYRIRKITNVVVTAPTVTTAAASSITSTSVVLGGNVTADGGDVVTERGVVYSTTNTTPTTSDTKNTNGTGTGSFSETITSLTAGTTYYVRAYAINSGGTAYGNAVSFTTAPNAPVVTSPANGSIINNSTPTYAGTAQANSTVTVYVDGAALSGTVTASASGSWSKTQPAALAQGSHTVYATAAINGSVASANSNTNNFAVDTTPPPAPVATAPANGSAVTTATPTYTGIAAASSTVTVIVDGSTIGTTAANASGNWSLTQPTALAQGSHTVRATATDAAGNVSPSSNTNTFVVDTTRPSVTFSSSAGSNGSTTGTSPIPFTITFSENVTGLTQGALNVTGGTVTNFSGSGTTYTFSLVPGSNGNTIVANLAANVAQDAAGNGNTAASQFSITYQQTTVASVTRLTPSPTATAQVSYRVVFSSSVTGVTASNFTITNGSSVSGSSVASVSGLGTTYTVVVNTGTGDGTLRLDVANTTGISPAVSNVPYTSGEQYTITKSFAAAPALRIQAAGSATNNGDVTAFVDVVQVLQSGTSIVVANALQNGSFETNNVDPSGFKKTGDGVVASPWSFTGLSGVARNGSAFGSTAANGDAVVLIQSVGDNNASISQSMAVPTGSYQVSFRAMQRNYTSLDQRLNVFVNDVFVGTIQPNNVPTYDTFTSAAFSVTAPALTATVSTTSASPTSTAPIPFSVSFSQSVRTSFIASDVTVAGGTVTSGSFSGSGAGPYTFTVTPSGAGTISVSLVANVAQDANNTGNDASNTVSVQFVRPTIVVGPASLPNGTQGTAYSQALSASGGTAPYSYSITNGALPAGLSLSSGGTIAGTPTANGSFTFTVTATDASTAPGPYTGSRSYTLVINPQPVTAAPVVTTPANGSQTNNPQPTYSGAAPANSTVTVYVGPSSGTASAIGTTTANASGNFSLVQPTSLADGTYQVYTTAQTSGSAVSANSNTNSFTVDAMAPTVALSSATVTNGGTTSTSPVSFTATFSEAVTGFTAAGIAVSGGTVTSGPTAGSGNTYSFQVTPSGAGNVTVQVRANAAQDQAGNSNPASAAYAFTFQAPTIAIAPASLPNGTQGTAYSVTFSASGGTAPYSYSITNGAVPAGMSLSASGTLSGTPTANGTFNFTVTARDNSTAPGPYTGSRSYTLTINAPAITAVTWTGATNTDWFTATNWSSNTLPSATISATIPTAPSGGRFPFITANTASVRNLTLNSGSALNQSGGTLVVAGDLTNNGTFLPTGGTVLLGNTALSSILGSSSTRFWNLTVGASGAQQSTSASTSVQRLLTLNGNFATNGNSFTLNSTANLTAQVTNNGGVVNGNVTVQRYIDPSLNPNLGYRHISTAVSGQTVSSLATASFSPVVNPAYNASTQPGTVTPFPTVYGYDQSRLATATNNLSTFDKGWVSPNALSDALNVGQGYTALISGGQTWAFTGPLNNGTQTLTLARNTGATASESGLSLVGNPYPSPLDWRQVASNGLSNVDGALYVFQSNDPSNPYAGSYGVYANGVGTVSPILAQGQGFFIRVTAGQSSGTLTFANSQRPTTYTATNYARTAAETRPLVQLSLKAAGHSTGDDAFVYFEQGSTEGFDAQYDAVKMANPSGLNLSTSIAGQQLSIDGRPAVGTVQRVIPLAVGVPAAGAYSLATAQLLNLDTTPVYLRDLQAGTLTDLRLTPSYQFTVTNASALITNRFELVFSPQQALATVPAALAQQVSLYPNPAKKAAFVELPASLGRQAVTASLVDALGRQVRTVSLPAQGALAHQLDLSELATGVYALRLSTSAGVVVKKLVIE